jgi:hypothetical protein
MLPIFSTIITAKMATLHELREVYYYEDALDIYDLIIVNNYNEYKYNEIQKLKAAAEGNK